MPFASAWSLWWTADRVAAGFRNFWDAPIFFPTRHTYAFSEPMLLEGMAAAPLLWMGASPVLACNLVLLAALVTNGAFALALLRALGLSPLAAVAGGAMLCLLPFVHHELGVLTLVPLAGVLATLHALLGFSRRATPARGLRLGIAFAAAYLLCGQNALFLALVAGPAALCLVCRAHFTPRSLVGVLVAAATAAVLLLPIVSAQLEARRVHGFVRSLRASAQGAAAPGAFWTTPAPPLLAFPGVHTASDPNQRALFPGALKLALALAGLAWGLGRAETRRFGAFLLAMAAGAVALSLLPGFEGARKPIVWLRDWVPGLAQLRSFWRAAMLMQVATALLAAAGIEAIARAARRPSPPAARRAAGLLVIAIAAAASVELWPPAPGLSAAPAREAWRPWLDWIDQHVPPGAALVHLPVPASGAAADYEETARAMLLATGHGRPLVNGYSSNFPRGYLAFARSMRGCPTPAVWSLLHKQGLRFFSLRSSWLASDPRCGPTEALYRRAAAYPELDAEIWQAVDNASEARSHLSGPGAGRPAPPGLRSASPRCAVASEGALAFTFVQQLARGDSGKRAKLAERAVGERSSPLILRR